MENTETNYELTGSGIDAAGGAAYAFLTAARVKRKNALRVRLALEEALLRYRDEGTAEVYDVPITPTFLLTALFIGVMLAIAAPPVPGSALACYTLLFTQLGVPMEAVAIMTALNVILEFLATSSDLFCLQMALTDLGGELEMLDLDTLRSRT